jgi:dihydrodipicolinate synthase/N-acetylneuraminate lyase
MTLPYTRSETKDRVRETWKGACNVTIPSYTLDFSRLNEKAIRHDIKRSAELGFWGTLVASECGTTVEEYCRFMEIAADAAPKDLRLVCHGSFNNRQETIRAAKCAEELGFEGLLTSYPPEFRPKSAKDIVDYTRDLSQQTDLALILFVVPTWGFRPLHPSHFPPEAVEQMAAFDTAAAIKYEANPPGMPSGLADIRRRVAKHGVIVECPLEQYAPGLIDWYGCPWIGTSAYDSFGDRVPKWFKLLHEGKWDEGMVVYWSYQAARDAKGQFHASFPGANLIHRVGWKYLSWLQGFSGGLLRMPQMRLNPGQMRALRTGLQQSGFELPANDDEFYTGRFPE